MRFYFLDSKSNDWIFIADKPLYKEIEEPKAGSYQREWENESFADFNIILRHEKDGDIIY